MGERVCYLRYCPACDAALTIVDEVCPKCGEDLAELEDPMAGS